MGYPSSLDNLKDDYAGTDRADTVDHAGMHSDERAAINAVQAELGVNPSGAAATVADLLRALEAGLPGLHFEVVSLAEGEDPTIAQETVGDLTTVTIGIPDGATGPAALDPNFTFATVPVAPGGTPTAVMTGTYPDLTVTLGIPTGATGAAGATAAALTTKGDLLSHDGSNGVRVPVGENGLFLVADSTTTPGVAWKAGAYTAQTANYTITSADSIIAVDTTAGAVTLTLPAASGVTGKPIRIIKTAGANTLTVQRAGSDTIVPSSGTRTAVAFPAAAVYGEMVLVSSGTVWRVVDGQASSEASGSRLWRWSQSLAGSSTTAAVGWRSQDIIGTGSPLSVVTPDYIGQLFQDTAVTLGARTWRATTLASSGWVVAEGDTGWRDVSGLLENSWAGANCLYIRRTTSLVQVTVEGASAASATSGVLLTLPAGFRPTGGTVRAILYTTGMTLRRVGVATTGIITVSSYAAGDTLYGTSVGMASSAWPTSALPGTAI